MVDKAGVAPFEVDINPFAVAKREEVRREGPPAPPVVAASGDDAMGILVLVAIALAVRREELRCCAKSDESGASGNVGEVAVARLRPEEDGRSSRVR